MSLAFALIQLGELEQAEIALDGSVPALLQVGDLKMAGGCLIAHGLIGRFSGRLDEAEGHYRHAFGLCVRTGDPGNAPACLEGVAAAVMTRDPEEAARLLGAARELFDTGHIPSVPGFEVFYEATLAQLAESIGEEPGAAPRARRVERSHRSALCAHDGLKAAGGA